METRQKTAASTHLRKKKLPRHFRIKWILLPTYVEGILGIIFQPKYCLKCLCSSMYEIITVCFVSVSDSQSVGNLITGKTVSK